MGGLNSCRRGAKLTIEGYSPFGLSINTNIRASGGRSASGLSVREVLT